MNTVEVDDSSNSGAFRYQNVFVFQQKSAFQYLERSQHASLLGHQKASAAPHCRRSPGAARETRTVPPTSSRRRSCRMDTKSEANPGCRRGVADQLKSARVLDRSSVTAGNRGLPPRFTRWKPCAAWTWSPLMSCCCPIRPAGGAACRTPISAKAAASTTQSGHVRLTRRSKRPDNGHYRTSRESRARPMTFPPSYFVRARSSAKFWSELIGTEADPWG
jgi:hypothetical protein